MQVKVLALYCLPFLACLEIWEFKLICENSMALGKRTKQPVRTILFTPATDPRDFLICPVNQLPMPGLCGSQQRDSLVLELLKKRAFNNSYSDPNLPSP